MSTRNRTSTIAWIVAHLVYPLLPASLEALIRFVVFNWSFRLDTINSATLSMSLALVAVFVNQSIRTEESRLSDKDEEASRNGVCVFFTIMAIVYFVLFGVITLLGTLVMDPHLMQLRPILEGFQVLTFVFSAIPLLSAIAAQRTYKLRASLV